MTFWFWFRLRFIYLFSSLLWVWLTVPVQWFVCKDLSRWSPILHHSVTHIVKAHVSLCEVVIDKSAIAVSDDASAAVDDVDDEDDDDDDDAGLLLPGWQGKKWVSLIVVSRLTALWHTYFCIMVLRRQHPVLSVVSILTHATQGFTQTTQGPTHASQEK